MAKVAFIGLGTMGFPIAGQLAKAGHGVTVYNRTPAKAERWLATYGTYGARSAATPAGGAEGAGTSWFPEHRGGTMIDICTGEAAANGADLTMTRLIDGFFGEVQQLGGGRQDLSALIRRPPRQ